MAIPTIQTNNEKTRVTEWRFAPNATTGFHKHEYDYVIIPITTGTLMLIDSNGEEKSATLSAGVSYFRNAGIEHDVRNSNDYEFSFVEVEFK